MTTLGAGQVREFCPALSGPVAMHIARRFFQSIFYCACAPACNSACFMLLQLNVHILHGHSFFTYFASSNVKLFFKNRYPDMLARESFGFVGPYIGRGCPCFFHASRAPAQTLLYVRGGRELSADTRCLQRVGRCIP